MKATACKVLGLVVALAAGSAAAQVPYFVWVSIATVLQLSITWMNW